jgi:hypothetical protein
VKIEQKLFQVIIALYQCYFFSFNNCGGQAPVAHACNPSYSRGRNQEDHGSKPVQANSSGDPISKIPTTKKGLVEWLKV